MTAEPPKDETELREAFETLWNADVAAGINRGLTGYLEHFSDQDTTEIARWWIEITDHEEEEGVRIHSDGPIRRIGPYLVVRELGRGGQATVYLADDPRLSRQVAVKVLTGWGPASEVALARFRREAEVASRLDHPGICTVYDTGIERERAYIVMRYVEGASLRKQIARASAAREKSGGSFVLAIDSDTNASPDAEALSEESTTFEGCGKPREIIALFEQAARALHAAHEAGVIHRDIKPGNIIIDEKGRPVIVDFGLARDVESLQSPLTQSGELFGTPAYMAPERLGAREATVDARTDVYSLGVTLFEVLTLERPFRAATRQALYQAIMTKEAPDPCLLNPSIPTDLSIVLQVALEKDPSRRYQSAQALADDLEHILKREPIAARPASLVHRLKRWTVRNPVLAPTILGLFLVLALGLLTALVLLETTRQERDAKEQALAELERMSDIQKVHDLQSWSEDLWPADRLRLEGPRGINAWLKEAEGLLLRRPLHTQTRDQLRKQGRFENGDWKFEDAYTRFRHSALTDLVSELDALPASTTRMHRRRTWCQETFHATVTNAAQQWSEANTYLQGPRAKSLYQGALQLQPQEGLYPLGPDPKSGLLEFAVWQTGNVEPRQHDGSLKHSSTLPIILVLIPSHTHPPTNITPSTLIPSPKTPTAFFISKFEMTRAQWRRIMNEDPSLHADTASPQQTDRLPVEQITAKEAQLALSRINLTLPTIHQWEVAASCNLSTLTAYSPPSTKLTISRFANLADTNLPDHYLAGLLPNTPHTDGHEGPAPVGSFQPTQYGLFDIHGNVWELCTFAPSPNSSTTFTARGGAFFSPPEKATIKVSLPVAPSFKNRGLGVRPARALQ